MNIKIIRRRTGKKGTIYSIQLAGQPADSLDSFIQKYYPQNKEEVTSIAKRLEYMLNRTGFQETYFISESPDCKNLVYKIKYVYPHPKLRLACIRLNTSIIIIGGGAIKKAQKWQDDAELSVIYNLLIKIDTYIANNNNINFYNDEIEIEI